MKVIKLGLKDIDLLDLPSGTYIQLAEKVIIMTRSHYKEFKQLFVNDDNITSIKLITK